MATIHWKVPEPERIQRWIPSNPYDFNPQYRDILPIARIAQIYTGAILWIKTLLEEPHTGEVDSAHFKYTKKFLVAQSTLAMNFMEHFPHLPTELPGVHPEIRQRRDFLTEEVFETLQKAFDLRNVSVRDFWNWLLPLKTNVCINNVVRGPISQTHTVDICERASCFDVIDAENIPEWFLIRMRK